MNQARDQRPEPFEAADAGRGRDLRRSQVSPPGPDRKPGRGFPERALPPRAGLAGGGVADRAGLLPLLRALLPRSPGSPEGTSSHHSDPLVLLHLLSQPHFRNPYRHPGAARARARARPPRSHAPAAVDLPGASGVATCWVRLAPHPQPGSAGSLFQAPGRKGRYAISLAQRTSPPS